MPLQIDHVVIAAATLAQGAAWCEATLGAAPGAGGQHPLMGTHNRLMKIESAMFPLAYLEIIAIDPAAAAPGRARWFGLDDAGLRARLAVQGPALIHVVARTDDLARSREQMLGAGQDPGVPIAAHRDTPAGRLAWRILVRDDGRLPAHGALPTLLEWQGTHPALGMPASAVQLGALTLRGLSAPAQALLAMPGVGFAAGPGAALRAEFITPKGPVVLESPAP
ncbi:MAG: VOC family protein [Rubrivivax sp.]|nr:VOC family protein [Rubrivivax sp.]